jgi:hypothetical protein
MNELDDVHGCHAFAKQLTTLGYSAVFEQGADYDTWKVNGKGITGAFCSPNGGQSYSTLDGKFAADNNGCFNKWSQCPLVVNLPCNVDELKQHLEFLGSGEGYEHSNRFEYLDKRILPYDMKFD